MSRCVFSADAAADLRDIAEYIARDNPTAARDWLAAVRQRCELLANHPFNGEVRPDFGVADCRSVSVGNYVVFFRSSPAGVEIARIIHGSRDLRTL